MYHGGRLDASWIGQRAHHAIRPALRARAPLIAMSRSVSNPKGLTPSFNGVGQSILPGDLRVSSREAYYHLINVEEHPEALPLAYDVVAARLDNAPSAIH